jgi:UDP-glucose 4-epimerase
MHYSRILVSGGAGFVGSHIVDELLNDGYEVNIIDDLSYGARATPTEKST